MSSRALSSALGPKALGPKAPAPKTFAHDDAAASLGRA